MQANIKLYLAAFIILAIGVFIGFVISNDRADQLTQTGIQPNAGSSEVWTCSMHPQIRQNEPGLCPICEMELIPLDQNTSSDPLVLEMTTEAVKLAQVQTTIVGSEDVQARALTMTGKIQEDERLVASQSAHIPGRIEQLFVTFTGERVRAGQKLATLYSPELVTAQRELLEALAFADVNPAIVEAARKKLYYWKITAEQIASIEESGTIQEAFPVFSDASGFVTQRRVSVGDYVRQGQVIFELVSYDNLWVLFDAYEEDLGKIRLGDRIDFTTPALPGITFRTSVTYIDPAIDPSTRVASVRTEIGNRSGALKPEMFVRGVVRAHTAPGDKIAIPKSAVLWTGPRSVVYVKKQNATIPSFEYREVELGTASDKYYEILSGVTAGEEIVTNGNFAIDAAAQLNNQQSMMNQRVTLKGMQQLGPDFSMETPAAFKSQLAAVVREYLTLKDALVASDSAAARSAANQIVKAASNVDMMLLSGNAHDFWMEQSQALKAHAERLAAASGLPAQRTQFGVVSNTLIGIVRAFRISGSTLYVQHCPMAFDNAGADWLSSEEQILNPYFGEQMLKCGKVTETFPQPGQSVVPATQQVHHH